MMVQLVRCNGELVLQPEDQLSHKIEHVWAGFQPDLLIENKTEIIFEERDPIVLPVSNNQRYYYVYEVEGKKYLLAERTIHIDGTFNMRDIGGYRTKDGRHVKWGRFFL
jgi:protein-tyrosine phosphatase